MKITPQPVWLPPSTSTPNLPLISTGNGSGVKWGYSLTGGAGSMGSQGPQGPQGASGSVSGNDAGRVYATSATTLIDATATAITFSSASYTKGAMGASGSGLTTGTAGVYHVSGCVSITPSSSITDFQVQINLNGSAEALVSALPSLTASQQSSIIVSGDFYIGSGVTIELFCQQTSGSNRTNTTGSVFTWLSAHLVSI